MSCGNEKSSQTHTSKSLTALVGNGVGALDGAAETVGLAVGPGVGTGVGAGVVGALVDCGR